MSEAMGNEETIETGLGSIGKIKIIKALAEDHKLATIYMLHKKTRLKRDDIKSNLDDLVRIGWVVQSKYANLVYGVNNENGYVAKLIEFFKEIGYVGQP